MGKNFVYNLGLDLGTSNTACSYLDESGNLVSFEYAGAAQTPSILSDEYGMICIGNQARNRIGYGTEEGIYRSFKMHVDIKDTKELERLGYTEEMGPGKVMEEYIINYLDAFMTEMDVEQVNSITIGAPEIFFRTIDGTDMRMELKKNVERTGYAKTVRVVSEPAAASAYYLYTNEQKQSDEALRLNINDNCYLLTVDAGGGTLDITLAHHSIVDGKRKIYVVARSGAGENHDNSRSYGKSGVYYFEEVIRAAIRQQNPELDEIEEDGEFKRAFCELEDYIKTMNKRNYEVMIDRFKSKQRHRRSRREEEPNMAGVTVRYKGQKLPVTYDLMYDVYKNTFHNILEEELNKIRENKDVLRCGVPFDQMDGENGSSFRVVMVGGFSAFPLVRYQVEQYFGKLDVDDPRFGTVGVKEASQAVANGLALLGSKTIEYSLRAPYGLGVIGQQWDEQGKKKEYTYIGVKYGDFLNPDEDRKNPFMAHFGNLPTKAERKENQASFWWPNPPFMAYCNGNSDTYAKREINPKLKETMKEMIQRHITADGNEPACCIGFSFDESCMLYIHFIEENEKWTECMGPLKLDEILNRDEGAVLKQTVDWI